MTIPAPFAPYRLGLVLLKTLEEPGGYVYFVLHIGDVCERWTLVSPQPMTAEVIIEGSKASLKGKGPVCGEELVE